MYTASFLVIAALERPPRTRQVRGVDSANGAGLLSSNPDTLTFLIAPAGVLPMKVKKGVRKNTRGDNIGGLMKRSNGHLRHAFLMSVTAVAVGAMTVAVVTSSVGAQPKPHAGPAEIGPGYPPPGGIYTAFTNCPLYNQLMHESVQFTACTGGLATSGSITIGNITTPVVRPVSVQFGFWTGVNQPYYADVVPPPAGVSALLSTKPDLIPESLTTALGCPSTNTVVENLCTKATYYGGRYLDVYALAEAAGPITNFQLLSWTQPVMFRLVNPLLGNKCTIGTLGDPVVLSPTLSITTGQVYTDPNPTEHPDTEVLATLATASDTTFAAPGVSGCGPGGVGNIAVDAALDASSGLPSASGVNSLTLTGSFDVAVCSASEDSTLPQPQDDAKILLSAFKASVGLPPPPPPSASGAPARRISGARLHRLLRRLGIH
jgi:hypothetical protein